MRGLEVGPKNLIHSNLIHQTDNCKNALWTPDAMDLGVWMAIRHTRQLVWSPARAKQARRQGPWRLGVGLVFLHTAC